MEIKMEERAVYVGGFHRGFVKVAVYVTKDGMKYDNANDCMEHEAKLGATINTKSRLRNAIEPISHDLERTILIAKSFAEKHQINYNIILMNPNPHGDFDIAHGSTYEFVADSYFEKPRPNVKVLYKTDDLFKNQNQ